MNRRAFLATGCAAFAARNLVRGAVPMAQAFDREVEAFMQARAIPGGALAVVKDRRLVYARGYGFADREKQIPTQADALFRIASISKPLTAVAILKLVEAGNLHLEQRAFDLLEAEPLGEGDPRLREITIRQLLHHTGGWDREKSFDPMFRSRSIARAAGVNAPAMPSAIIRYMLGRPLDFAPGERYAYSNFGYCVLGRVIEQIAGQTYEEFVRAEILRPMNIRRMQLGATLESRAAPGEVHYHMPRETAGESVFGEPSQVAIPYGTFCLEAMDAHGGWIASAIDLARFAAALDDPAQCPILKKESLAALSEPPPPPVSRGEDGTLAPAYYGCGWWVRPVGKKGGANYWHNGSLPGTATLLVRRADGLSWAILFNQRSADEALPDTAIDPALHRAAAAIEEWPSGDLFGKYG